jgi:hypothetical protein
VSDLRDGVAIFRSICKTFSKPPQSKKHGGRTIDVGTFGGPQNDERTASRG